MTNATDYRTSAQDPLAPPWVKEAARTKRFSFLIDQEFKCMPKLTLDARCAVSSMVATL